MPTGPGAVPASSAGMHGYTGSGFRVLRQKFDRCKVSTYLGAGGKAWEKWDSVSVLLVESGGGGVNRGLRHSGRLATSTVRPKPNPIHLQLRILGFRIYGFS